MLYASAHIVATNPNLRVNGKCFDELVPSSGQTTRRNGNFFRTKQCMIQQIYKYLFNFMLDRAWDFPWTPSPNIQIYVSKVWREKKQNETVASLHIHCYYFQQPWISDINCPCTKFRVYFNQLIWFRPLVVNNIFIFPWIRIGNDFFFFCIPDTFGKQNNFSVVWDLCDRNQFSYTMGATHRQPSAPFFSPARKMSVQLNELNFH